MGIRLLCAIWAEPSFESRFAVLAGSSKGLLGHRHKQWVGAKIVFKNKKAMLWSAWL
jgi:hypothetical protein